MKDNRTALLAQARNYLSQGEPLPVDLWLALEAEGIDASGLEAEALKHFDMPEVRHLSTVNQGQLFQ